MNELEAIKNINALNAVCGQKDFYDEEFARALSLAIQSLEMQIPKKMDRYYCPICRHYFEDGEVNNYCPACGQKLENDWG